MLLIAAPWLLVNQFFYAAQRGLPVGPAIGLSALGLSAHLVVMVVLLWAVVPLAKHLFKLRSVMGLQLVFFTFGGLTRATVMVLGTPGAEPFLDRWGLLALSWALNTGIWMAASAILVSWWDQVREQRMALEAEYERQVLTRGTDARALAEADQQLAALRQSTHAALAEIRTRLDGELVGGDLDDCIEVIDGVVAGLVRPASHDLARMPIEIEAIRCEPLWRGWREVIPAGIRSWPVARPFQPGVVGLLCLPMVMVAELVPTPHGFDAGSIYSVGVFALHLLLLLAADRLLGPQVARIPARAGVSVVLGVYLVMYLIGLTTLTVALGAGVATPLEAFLVPPLLAMISGGISAFSKIRTAESAAARALIRRTNWEVRRTRQRLWAQRRRLAMALHGRVQANLTAASLMLGLARDRVKAGESLDQQVVERVRSTLALADLIDRSVTDTPAVRLNTVAKVWQGVLSVTLDLRPGGLRLLEAGRDLTDACVEVVREILLNSVRHSGATHVEVVIGADQESLLCIRLTEMSATRTPLGSIGGPGLGRTLIDSLAVDWAESDGEQGRVTVAMLAAGAANTSITDARRRLVDVSMLT